MTSTPNEALVAQAPTAEVLAAHEADERIEFWSVWFQRWDQTWLVGSDTAALREVDPSTPQPGLRLVSGPQVGRSQT